MIFYKSLRELGLALEGEFAFETLIDRPNEFVSTFPGRYVKGEG